MEMVYPNSSKDRYRTFSIMQYIFETEHANRLWPNGRFFFVSVCFKMQTPLEPRGSFAFNAIK